MAYCPTDANKAHQAVPSKEQQRDALLPPYTKTHCMGSSASFDGGTTSARRVGWYNACTAVQSLPSSSVNIESYRALDATYPHPIVAASAKLRVSSGINYTSSKGVFTYSAYAPQSGRTPPRATPVPTNPAMALAPVATTTPAKSMPSMDPAFWTKSTTALGQHGYERVVTVDGACVVEGGGQSGGGGRTLPVGRALRGRDHFRGRRQGRSQALGGPPRRRAFPEYPPEGPS